jgi:hypothetical protein
VTLLDARPNKNRRKLLWLLLTGSLAICVFIFAGHLISQQRASYAEELLIDAGFVLNREFNPMIQVGTVLLSAPGRRPEVFLRGSDCLDKGHILDGEQLLPASTQVNTGTFSVSSELGFGSGTTGSVNRRVTYGPAKRRALRHSTFPLRKECLEQVAAAIRGGVTEDSFLAVVEIVEVQGLTSFVEIKNGAFSNVPPGSKISKNTSLIRVQSQSDTHQIAELRTEAQLTLAYKARSLSPVYGPSK